MEMPTAGQGMEGAGRERLSLGCLNLALRLEGDQLACFFPLLQRGVILQAVVGGSLRELLCDQLGIPADYVAGRITTIFLDNKPVDDLDCTVGEGARIALSAAMPGLVGAVMRRSGFYAALRQGITHAEKSGVPEAGSGTVRLKLFNLLLPEIGPLILGRGILVEPAELDGLQEELTLASRMGSSFFPPGERDGCCRTLLTVQFEE
jgi:hypothetical protein